MNCSPFLPHLMTTNLNSRTTPPRHRPTKWCARHSAAPDISVWRRKGENATISSRRAFPSHGRGRRFNPYSAHQQIKYLATPPETRDSLRSEYHPGNKKAAPGLSRAALGFCGRVASDGRARSSLPHDSRPRNGSPRLLVIEAFAFRHGLDLQSLVSRHCRGNQRRHSGGDSSQNTVFRANAPDADRCVSHRRFQRLSPPPPRFLLN
jgi:hypothetical protein